MKIAVVGDNGRVTRRIAAQSTRSVRLRRNFVLDSLFSEVTQHFTVAAQPRIQSHSVDLPAALSFLILLQPVASNFSVLDAHFFAIPP